MPNLPRKQKRRAYMPERTWKPDDFGNKAYPFYNSQPWRKVSTRYRKTKAARHVETFHDGTQVKTDWPACEVCGKNIAAVVDHIIPVVPDERGWPTSDGGAPFDNRNHMAMCHPCHNRKRGKESHVFVVPYIKTGSGLIPENREDIIKALQ